MLAKKIKYGDTIGIVAPSNALDEKRKKYLTEAEQFFLKRGFHIKRGKYIFENWYGSAGTPNQRAEDINEMFADDEVDMIICIEGGATCNTILPYLDYQVIQNHPKIITGFSDISVLLEVIQEKTGLITFHGAEFYEYGIASLQQKLWHAFEQRFIYGSAHIFLGNDIQVLQSGKIEGKSIGTNLGCTMNLLGTSYFPNMKDKVLFLEAYQVTPTECAQRFSQLKQSGVFSDLQGVVIGYIDAFQKEDISSHLFEDILLEIVDDPNLPVVKCNTFGHKIANEIIPIGVEIKWDEKNKTIEILQPFLS